MQLNDGTASEARGDATRSESASTDTPQQLWFDGELQDASKLQATLGTHAPVSYTHLLTTPAMTSPTKPRIAIVGYGSQGRAHALNLRDSGFDVTIGLRPGGPTELKAKADGFTVKTPADAVKDAEIVAILTPDMVQPQLYGEVIEPNIAQGACPVSYTHLDVYKRQALSHAQWRHRCAASRRAQVRRGSP